MCFVGKLVWISEKVCEPRLDGDTTFRNLSAKLKPNGEFLKVSILEL